MFQSSAKRLRALLSLAEDVLGDPGPLLGYREPPLGDPEPQAPHPHRRPLRFEHQRRPGSVAPPPAHCISPVRPAPRRQRHERVS